MPGIRTDVTLEKIVERAKRFKNRYDAVFICPPVVFTDFDEWQNIFHTLWKGLKVEPKDMELWECFAFFHELSFTTLQFFFTQEVEKEFFTDFEKIDPAKLEEKQFAQWLRFNLLRLREFRMGEEDELFHQTVDRINNCKKTNSPLYRG